MKHATIKTYEQAKHFLGSKIERPYAHNTRIEINFLLGREVITVKYHGNPIVNFFPDGTTTFNSCGWRTITTKERINWFLPDGFTCYQEKSVWYIADRSKGWQNAKTYIFADGIAIKWGTVYNDGPQDEQAAIKAKIKQIKAYVNGFVAELLVGNVPAPGLGDCIPCRVPGFAGGADHIESHLEESYYVPSLLVRAAEETGRISDFTKSSIALIWQGEVITDWRKSLLERDVKAALTAYIKHALNIAQ